MIKYLFITYRNIVNSIAFLPAIISLCFLLLAVGVLQLDLEVGSDFLFQKFETLQVKGSENARSLLTALITGIISLMVFSFSIVMILINQATASFTPRFIPGLLTDKKHQFVLGFYLGSIIYFIIQILNIKENEGQVHSLKFGILLAMVFGMICLALFILFIHLISLKFQVDRLCIYCARQSIRMIEKIGEITEKKADFPRSQEWYTLHTFESGYLSEVDVKNLSTLCEKHQLQLEILHRVGSFCLKDTPLCRLSRNIHDKPRLQDRILSCFNFSYQPYSEKSFLYGINQITEIAVKALSPGINDPGTATIALDHLSAVFCVLLSKLDQHAAAEDRLPFLLLRKPYSLRELFFNFINPIRHYGKGDAKIQAKLLEFYARLLPFADEEERHTIEEQLRDEMVCIERHVEEALQLDTLKKQYNAIHVPKEIRTISHPRV